MKIAVLIPSYKEDSIILETAKRAIEQNYPNDHFDVILIADKLQNDTLNALSKLPVTVIKVTFDQSTKAKSIKHALQQLPTNYYDVLMILDADNIMEDGCLEKTNHAFQKGWQMIQLHRTAKNRNTPTAILDAASEEINNHIFRRGHRALGLSSALIGSGMAFDYESFRTLMLNTDIENNPGEDREIYLEMLKKGDICEYIEDALVYDEKVQCGEILKKQRTRWFSAQLQYAKRFWIKEPFKTLSTNIHYLDYALQTLLLPRIMLLAITFGIFLLLVTYALLTNAALLPTSNWALMLFPGCLLSIIISLYHKISMKDLKRGAAQLPLTLISFSKAILMSSPNQKEFIHTRKDFDNKPNSNL